VGIAAAIGVYAAAGWISLQNQNRVPYQPDPGLLENERARLLSEETLNDVEIFIANKLGNGANGSSDPAPITAPEVRELVSV